MVSEIHKPITQKKGYFITGKFDQFQRNIPFYAITQSLNQFCEYLLSEDDQTLERWKKLIQEAVGNNGQVLVEVIPYLELVIGKQPEIISLDAQKSQNRFNFVFQAFMKAISQEEHPLVLFIDDLQWADLASLNLLKTLMQDNSNAYFLVIGAYRNNEVSASHPLMLTVEEIEKGRTQVAHIALTPLATNHIQELIADALSLPFDSSEAKTLAELVQAKTNGNAFFTVELLKSLYTQELLRFDHSQVKWHWDASQITSVKLSGDVIDLMTSKINRLPDNTQQVLKLASCIGNQFDLATLAIIYENTQLIALQHLWKAIEEGLLIPLDNHYKLAQAIEDLDAKESLTSRFRFAHDKIQQATYLLMQEEEKKVTHLKVGRLLWNSIDEQALSSDYLFDVVNHLDKALDKITDADEKLRLCKLNLQAGKKAKLSGAYEPAFNYFNTAIELLTQDSWQQNYALTLEIYNQSIESTYLMGDYEQMDSLIAVVFDKANNLLDKINAYETRIVAFTVQTKFNDAIRVSLQLLKMLGVSLPESPGKLQVARSLLQTKFLLRNKAIKDLVHLPQMTDEKMVAAMRILIIAQSASYFTNSNLLAMIVFKMVRLSVNYGNHIASTMAYAGYGLILCNSLGSIEKGNEIGELSMNLLKPLNAGILESKVIFTNQFFIRYWKHPLRDMKAPLRRGYQIGLENGDTEYASYCLSNYSVFPYYYGEKLDTIVAESFECRNILEKLKQDVSVDRLEIFIQTFLCLTGQTKGACDLSTDTWDEETKLKYYNETEPNNALWNYYFNKQILHYLAEQNVEAFEMSKGAEQYISAAFGSYTTCLFYFYNSLIMLAIYSEKSASDQKAMLKKVNANQKKLKKWMGYCPANFAHKYYLVEAEKCRVLEQPQEASKLYDQAIAAASESEYLQEDALANELAAKFWLQMGKDDFAGLYMQKAYYLYNIWGGKVKTAQLENSYRHLIRNKAQVGSVMHTISETSSGSSNSNELLDLASILKASQTMSQEVKIDSLLENILKVLLENSGAQRVLLIGPNKGKLVLQAIGDQDKIATVDNESLDEDISSSIVSLNIVNYVARTKEYLLVDDALKEERYAADAYIQQAKPRSILCFPVLRQSELKMIFYLENRLSANTFTPERLETLNMLSSQVSISMENATLYENLEEKVRERTKELEDKNVAISEQAKAMVTLYNELEQRNKDVTASINYARRIQKAVLPVEESMQAALPEHFVLYRPRDVVSGDFYWFDIIEDKIFLVVADCTGHGVPGAFMTMLGTQALNEIVKQKKIYSPELILKDLDHTMRRMLQRKHTQISDGMDAVVCVIDKKQNLLQFAGAHNSLIVVEQGDLRVIKGDSLGVNGYRREGRELRFTLHNVPLNSPMTFYMYSDGYQDQFGGEHGKKFMKKRLRETLHELSDKPMEEQKQILEDTLDNWMGDHRQIDDIVVMGVKV